MTIAVSGLWVPIQRSHDYGNGSEAVMDMDVDMVTA
jgi:hypothetical protein